jgi:hypothetical protein
VIARVCQPISSRGTPGVSDGDGDGDREPLAVIWWVLIKERAGRPRKPRGGRSSVLETGAFVDGV